MQADELALAVWELNDWLEQQHDGGATRVRVDVPQTYVSISLDPQSHSPAASINSNRITCCGDGGLDEQGLISFVEGFRASGIPRVFLWLSPGPRIERMRDWSQALGFQRVPWTRYPTLLHGGPVELSRQHPFDIRRVGVAAFTAARDSLGDAVMTGYTSTLEKPGFHHFIAYDGPRAVAAAALVQHAGIGYLTWAGTIDTDRRRGAQSSLIAHRVALARELGCRLIVSQTLTLLEDSLANLRRAGFVEVYEQEVFELTFEK